jgi:murein L,D-transpeptidase YafK
LASAALAAAFVLTACDTDSVVPSGRANAPLSDKMQAELVQKRMDKESPILVRLFKEEAELEVWKKNQDGEYALLKTYPICRWSGGLGPKIKEGDRQAPEGFYAITPGQMNPNSNYYLAFNTGYPNAFDRAWGRTGSQLMVHGDCSSRGCYAMTDEQMVEIYALARESFFGGQKSFQLQAYPFRMTPRNMARHRNSPHLAFWKNIKTGYDHFEVTHQEPKVDVCDRRYVFDAASPNGSDKPLAFSPKGKCPVYQVPAEIAELMRDRRQREGSEFADLVNRNVEVADARTGVDGGMNPVFYDKLNPTGDAALQVSYAAPGALPRTPNQPSARVVPPAQPTQVAAAPVATAQVASLEEETEGTPANVPVPRTAPQAKEGTAPEDKSGLASLIGGIFGSSQSPAPAAKAQPQPAAAPKPAAKPHAIAAAKPAAKPTMQTASAPAPKPAPKKPDLRPSVKPEPQVATAKPQTPAPQAPAREPEMRTAFQSAPKAGTMSGAQPVVPAGSFESRWSAFR